MARKSPAWHKNALNLFESPPHQAFTDQQLRSHLRKHWERLRAPASLTPGRVIEFLVQNSPLERIEIEPDAAARKSTGQPYKKIPRYVWPDTTPLSLALSLRSKSYFTHATAIHLLGLSNEIPATIYVNREQSPKPPTTIASQAAIDRAFKAHPRLSKYAYVFKGQRLLLLSGKNTGRLEVSETRFADGEFYPVTKVERTLIDCVVRPTYAGGIFHVREVFANARDRVSVNVLAATLRKLDYAYPYHQAIGFIMQRTGYSPRQCERLRKLGLEYEFYLSHRMTKPQYDSSWRIHYPGGF